MRMFLRNIFSQWMLYLLNALMLLGITPLLVHRLGADAFGLWALGGNFVAWLMLLDFGMNDAAIRYGALLIRDKRMHEYNNLFNTSLCLFLMIGLVAETACVLIGALVPQSIFSSALMRGDFLLFTGLLGGALCFSFWAQPFSSILQAHQRFDRANQVKAMSVVLRMAGYAWVAMNDYGVIGLAAVTCLGGLVSLLGLMLISRSQFAWHIDFSSIRRVWIWKLMGFGWLILVVTVSDMVRFQTDNIILATYASLSVVTLFSIGATIPIVFRDVVGSIVGLLLPAFSRKTLGEGFPERFLSVTKVFTIVVWSLAALAIALGKHFIILWMGNDFVRVAPVLYVMMIGFVVASAQSMTFSLIYGLSAHGSLAVLSVLDAGANIMLSLWLVRDYGAFGVAVGTALPLVLSYGFIFPVLAYRVIGCSLHAYVWKAIAYPMLCGTILALSGLWLMNICNPHNWGMFLLIAICMAICFAAMAWFIFLDKDSRRSFRRTIHARA